MIALVEEATHMTKTVVDLWAGMWRSGTALSETSVLNQKFA